jgi:hypothetical protein
MKAKRGVICPLAALAVLLAMVVLVAQWDTARAATYNPTLTATLSDSTAGANADVTTEFKIPAGDAMFDLNVAFMPGQFTLGASIPIGAYVADLGALTTLGLLNQPCQTPMQADLKMLNGSVNTAVTVVFEDTYSDIDGNGVPEGADKYPAYLNTLFPGMTPVMRWFGAASVSGTPVTENFVIFAPGTSMYGQSFDAAKGYLSVEILNDPTIGAAPSAITDLCSPMDAKIHIFAVSKSDTSAIPSTSVPGGAVVINNPTTAGDYTFSRWTTGIRDADGDGIDNYIDTCPYAVNTGTDADNDGLDAVCDPDETLGQQDYDSDGYSNRGDNCPLIANADQLDTDKDRIGDVCDQHLNDADAEGAAPLATPQGKVTITGGAATQTATPQATAVATATAAASATPKATAAASATPKATVTATPKATATATPKATATPPPIVVGGAGLLGSDGGFPTWAMYVIGVAAALMLAGVGTAATVAWRRRQ